MSKDEKELAMRGAHIDTIKRMKNDIEENIDKYGFFDLDERVKKLQSDWHKLEAKNLQIKCEKKSKDFDVEHFDRENQEIGNLCMDLKAKIRTKMADLENEKEMANSGNGKSDDVSISDAEVIAQAISVASKENEQKSKVLENKKAIQIESSVLAFGMKFNTANWLEFEKEFSEKVNGNGQLNNVEKLKLLYTACSHTEAEPILALLSSNDYTQAFNKLRDTFGTAYVQTNFFVKQLTRIRALENPNAMDFSSLVNRVEDCIAHMQPHLVKGFEQLIPFIIIEKLDENTRLAWERHRKILASSCEQGASEFTQSSYIPDWQALKVFLEDEADFYLQYRGDTSGIEDEFAAQASNQIQNKVKVQAATSNQKQMSKVNSYCNCEYRHPLHKCPVFMALSLEERERKVARLGLCVRCLRSHSGECLEPLNNQNCQRCWPKAVKHNGMLCPIRVQKAKEALAIVTPINSQPAWKAGDDWK